MDNSHPAALLKAQRRKDALIAALIDTRDKIIAVTAAFSPPELDEVFLGVWSVMDILAHLIGWLVANRAAILAIRAGQLPDFYADKDRGWQTYNALLVSRYKRASLAEMTAELRHSHGKLIDLVRSLPAEVLEADHGVHYRGYKVTIARLLQAELKDEKEHCQQMEDFRDIMGK